MSREAWDVDAAFIAGFQVEFRAPASQGELEEIEAVMKCPLPKEVRAWYEAADGGIAQAPGSELVLHSLQQVKEWFEASPLAKRGHFPFSTNNDSDPFCVCCKGPLLGHVIQMPHDDDPRLMYRTVAGFFRAAAVQLASEQRYDSHDLPSEFDGPERSAEDARIGRALIAQVAAKEIKKVGATIALMFAADLLSDVGQIRAVAELGAAAVRGHVLRRLERLGSDEAAHTASEMRREFDEFVEACAVTLKTAGIELSVLAPYGTKSLRIDPHNLWLNEHHFFEERRRPDFDQYLIERVRAMVAGRAQEKE